MNSSRHALAATILAAFQVAHAQVAAVPASTPSGASSAANAAEELQKQPDAAALQVANDTAEQARREPRIIQGTGQLLASPKGGAVLAGEPISFRFEEAPIAEVVRTVLGDILKADYILHPPLQGAVTLATRAPIAPDQAVFLLESSLQANGLALLRDARGTFHVGRPDALKNIGGAVRQITPGGSAIPPGYGTIIIPLQYIGAGEMAAILRPMVQAESLVRVDSVRNLLVMMGTRTQAEGWMELVNTFDVDLLKGMSVGVFPLKYASVKEVEVALRLVSGGGAAPATPTGAGGAAPAGSVSLSSSAAASAASAASGMSALGEGNPLFGALRIMPIERINSILVVTPRPSYLEEARRWIERLDKPSDGGSEPQLFIYQVQNGNARHLASVLGSLFGGQAAGTTGANSGVAPGLGTSTSQTGTGLLGSGLGNNTSNNLGGSRLGTGTGGSSGLNNINNRNTTQGTAGQANPAAVLGSIRVVADDLNNSVLVWSTKAEFNKIESTLKRLDLPLTQVLIEASIIEVTLDDSLQYGLQWSFSGDAQSGYRGIGNVGGLVASDTNPITSGGFSYALRNGAGSLKATLSALAKKQLVKMISNPSLMVLDNHTATITVGDQVPVSTSTTQSETTSVVSTSTIQYKDTGVSLSVTPSVNSGNVVAIQIDQTVTDVGNSVSTANNQPRFMQRQIGSKVAVRSGESIVLGGLIKDKKDSSKTGVPLLKDIPLVGNLFAQNSSEGQRTELLVIITPRVVRSDVDIREVSDDLRERLKGLRAIEVDLKPNNKPVDVRVQPSSAP